MADPAYRFYRHRTHPEFRLVLPVEVTFPLPTTPDQWEPTRDRQEADVSRDILEDIGRRGYALFRLGTRFSDIPETTTSDKAPE